MWYYTTWHKQTSAEVHPVQQLYKVNCGVISIVFAVTLEPGNNPALITYKQRLLKFHLNKCLKLEKSFSISTD